MNRKELIETLASRIKAIKQSGVVKVAIDGAMASGKTSLASEICIQLKNEGNKAYQSSVDDFFNSEEVRYDRGVESAIGCYEDTINIKALRSYLQKSSELLRSNNTEYLIFEGVFLQRPEIFEFWDYRIYLEVDPKIALSRALRRDLKLFNNKDDLIYKHSKRYTPAQDLYIQKVQPKEKANCIINNNNLDEPRIITNIQAST